MSTIRTPTGPLPRSVYWRRRAILLLVLVAVIAIIAIIAWPRGGGSETAPAGTSGPQGTEQPASGQTGQPTDEATFAAGDACDPSRIDITAETDATTYDEGVNPQLWLTVTSRQTQPCVFAVGTDLQEFRITSGSDLIWVSTDCQVDPQPYEQLLQPGVPVSTTPIVWDRTRSSSDTCDAERDPVVAGGASYHLEVKVGTLTSKSTKQFLLY